MKTFSLNISIVILLLSVLTKRTAAQGDEFMLTFRHATTDIRYISALYSHGTVFLPLGELFSLLEIHTKHDNGTGIWSGRFHRESTPWSLNPSTMQGIMGAGEFPLDTGDIRLGVTDLYLSPALFEKMFGLLFTISMNTLSLSLESRHPIPLEERLLRESRRRELDYKFRDTTGYPVRYPRQRQLFVPGMLDYNLGVSRHSIGNSYDYTITGAMEIFGGDLQGSVTGYSDGGLAAFHANNLQWRFAPSPNPYLSFIRAGQLSTTGFQGRRILGAAISNDPLQPREMYEKWVVEGTTIPDSEVELWANNQLTGFTRADALGYYRMEYPLSYGTVQLSLRIYTPTGEVITEEKQLQVPYTFLPEGVLTYHLQAGVNQEQTYFKGVSGLIAHADMAYGIMAGLTLKAGVDHYQPDRRPFYYGSLSARLAGQYLLNLDAAPGAFYRATGSVNYTNSRYIHLIFTEYDGSGFYNSRGIYREFSGNVYLPFNLSGLQHGMRLGIDHSLAPRGSILLYRVDWNSRIRRMNLRFNYRGNHGQSGWLNTHRSGMATTSATYTLLRTTGTPALFRGAFLRLQTTYNVGSGKWSGAGMQFSQTVFKTGMLTFSAEHENEVSFTRYQALLTFDLRSFMRLTSHAVLSRGELTASQSVAGSMGYDTGSRRVIAYDRMQTGQAAVSVRMFIDQNGDGKFNQGEEVVPAKGITVNQASAREPDPDGILRITQLQNYWTYQAEIEIASLPDPSLAPAFTRFSFIPDPNHYKRINIPLYRTGILEGSVVLRKGGTDQGLGGIRLLLKGMSREYEETIHTFSDGGFYAMSLLPGRYTLEIDPVQLGYLQATSFPGSVEIEVKALPDGDFLDDVRFTMIPVNQLDKESQ